MKSEKNKKSKKKIVVICVTVAVILAVLLVPFKKEIYDDGGTVTYASLTYKIVKWKKEIVFVDNKFGYYEKTSVYFIPDCYKSLDELWKIEQENDPGISERLTEGTSAE